MPNIAAIVHPDLGLGFSLAGIAVLPCANHEVARQVLHSSIDAGAFDLIIVEQSMVDGLDSNERKDLLRQTRPLVVPIPGDLSWTDSEESSRDDVVQRLIRQAVGYQLNIHM